MENFLSGETPLLVFISSIINEDMSVLREQVTNHIKNMISFLPWTFENTPASSENVQVGYLRKVRESDFVVWLVGSETTTPVEMEVREAISCNKRLLVFKISSKYPRDEKTQNLLSEVGNRAKWVEISDNNQLLDALENSIGDEVIRAIRGKPGLGRIARINELMLASRARCIAKWQAAGISLEKAVEFFENSSIGKPTEDIHDLLERLNLVLLSGDFGAGKSLMAERILQDYIIKSIGDSSTPIPIFLKAKNQFDDLTKEALDLSAGLGDPRIQGALIIIDGVDEANLSVSASILSQARIVARTWPNTSIIITSRPLSIFSEIEEKIEITPLNEKEIVNLINRINNSAVDSRIFYQLPSSIYNAIQRPLFTILWARYLQQKHKIDRSIKTTGELINYFIEDVIPFSDENILKSKDLLVELAIKSTEYGGQYVAWRQIGEFGEINLLLKTRLVNKINAKIGFPLPIFTEWFAAHGLVNNRIDINEITKDLARLDKWYYPLIIVISMFPYEDVKRVFSPVVRKNPGLAAEIVNEGIDISFFDENNPLPSAKECGERIRETYLTWMSGIGDLSKYIAPIAENGNLYKIGITVSDNRLDVAWNNSLEMIDEVTELPIGFFVKGMGNPGWYSVQSSTIGSQMAWPWRWSFNDLSKNLRKFVSNKSYLISNGFMYKERIWKWALDLMGYGDLYDKQIDLDELESTLNKRLKTENSGQYTKFDELRNYLLGLRENGVTELVSQWPSSDKKLTSGGWIWDPYSDEQILKRSIAIYSAALEEYNQIINGLFGKLKPRMSIGTLLPVNMHGQIYFSNSQTFGRSPGLNWYFEPLPLGSKNIIQFELVDKPHKMIEIQELNLLNKRMRPNSQEWLTSFTHHGWLDVFGGSPLTKIVYKWLENDLKNINWIN